MVIINQIYVYTVVEHWDGQHNTFYFSIGEMIITIKDIYWIIRVLVKGRMIIKSS